MAFNIVWTGDVSAPSRGQLCVIPEDRREAPGVPQARDFRRKELRGQVGDSGALIRRRLAQGPVTIDELRRVGGCGVHTVKKVIRRLEAEGTTVATYFKAGFTPGQNKAKTYWIPS